MSINETTNECVVIRVDFVRAGAERGSRAVGDGATVISLADIRLAQARAALLALVSPQPNSPRGGVPGTFGGPF